MYLYDSDSSLVTSFVHTSLTLPIPEGLYHETTDLPPGYRQYYQIDGAPGVPGTEANQTANFYCPNGVKTINWRYSPNLGAITVHAKESALFACDPSMAAMTALPTLTGTEFELARQPADL